MNNLEEIAAALAPTVRFPQSVDPDAPVLDPDLIGPTSARLIYHPLLTNINLNAIAPEAQKDGATFNDWLRNLRLEAARMLWQDVMTQKKDDQVTKEMLDNFTLFTGIGRFNDTVIKRGRLVGYEIKLLNSLNIQVIIERIMTQFSEAQDVNLYLYHSENPNALSTITLTQSTANKAEWHSSIQELFFRDFDNDIAGGAFYLMYDEDAITGQAVTQQLNFGVPCRSCNRNYYSRYEKFSQYVKLRSVSVSATNKPADPQEMFDVNKLAYEPDNTFGLNFALSTYCDLTDYVTDHTHVFAEPLSKQLVMMLLKEVTASVRSNVISEKMKDNARFALQNAELGGENIVRDVERTKKALGFELSDIQKSVCLPKVAAQGIKYATVGNGRSAKQGGYNGYYY
jgi:hypothetical protein